MTKPTTAAIEAARERLAKALDADRITISAEMCRAGDYDNLPALTALAIALQEMSDAVKEGMTFGTVDGLRRNGVLAPFILPDPMVDPLVECLLELDLSSDALVAAHDAKWLGKALAARGLQIVPVQP